MSGADLDAVIAQLWAGFVPLARSRVEALEAYAAALCAGDDAPELRAAAASAAHKLAGALGSYARPGSDEASRLEVLLDPQAPATPAPEDVVPLVAVLRAAVDG